jgi:microcystin-dependent protein/cytoskeletal protein CcmA (bactofilin family)
MNSRLSVSNDVALNKNVEVHGTTLQQGDVSINANLTVANATSLNGNVEINGTTLQQGDVSMNSRLSVSNDVSINKNIQIQGSTIQQGDVNMNSRLIVIGDVSLNGNVVTITPDISDNSNKVATTAFVHNVMPTGAIIMWAGSINSIPSGWALCDGSNGTPDLRDRFIVGAGTANIGTTGGSATTTLTQAMLPPHIHSVSLTGNTNAGGTHSHIASVTETAHTHTYDRATLNSAAFNYNNAYPQNGTAYTYSLTNTSTTTGTRSTGLSVGVSQAADHTHSITITGNTGSIGSSTSFDTRPPYYTLCFLQKAY